MREGRKGKGKRRRGSTMKVEVEKDGKFRTCKEMSKERFGKKKELSARKIMRVQEL